MQRKLGDRLAVAREDRLERLDVLEFRIFFHDRGHAVQAIDHLRIDRMFDPQRAVLVESGDAFFAAARIWGFPARWWPARSQ